MIYRLGLRSFLGISTMALVLGAPSALARTPVQLALGGDFNCALFDDGGVKCWGGNVIGQLGLGDSRARGDAPGEMGTTLPLVNLGGKAVALAAGTAHGCALMETGALKCWGGNAVGQLGLGDNRPRGLVPADMGASLPAVNLGTGRKAVSLALGGAHTCALLDNSTVKCWGSNEKGQLGLGDTRTRGPVLGDMGDALPALNFGPTRVPIALSAGEKFTCAIFRGGELLCWGENAAGQLGRENTVDLGTQPAPLLSAPAVDLGPGSRAVRVVSGGNFNCVLTNLQQVKCFGLNNDGRLGLGDVMPRGTAAGSMGAELPAVKVEPGLSAMDVQCGKSGCCAIISLSAALKCWGANEEGQLGLEDKAARGAAADQMGISLPFVELGRLARVAQLAVGPTHACVLLESGAVKCWGKNDLGQLGVGSRNTLGDLPGSMGEALRGIDL